jgi:hypothetical protein
MRITVNTIVFYALTIWLLTIILVIRTDNLEVLKVVSVIISNLISGWLGYLVRLKSTPPYNED